MKIILTAVDEPLAEAWSRFCDGFDFVSVHFGSAVELTVDAVISPANSFGFMDGGIDMIYQTVEQRHLPRWPARPLTATSGRTPHSRPFGRLASDCC